MKMFVKLSYDAGSFIRSFIKLEDMNWDGSNSSMLPYSSSGRHYVCKVCTLLYKPLQTILIRKFVGTKFSVVYVHSFGFRSTPKYLFVEALFHP